MLSKEIIAQIRRIQLKAGHLVTDALAGEYSSAFKGLGIELEKVREYLEGDDVRAIDWNVTARMNAPFVKVYKEERELTVMLMIDVSSSLRFGTSGKLKSETAAELAAILAFLATKNNDKVGLILFSDHVEHYVPPQKGRGHIWRLIRSILTHNRASEAGTDLKSACDFLNTIAKRKTMCFLLSDFYCDHFEKVMAQVSRRHDLICVGIHDEKEKKFGKSGILSLRDAETGEEMILDTGSSSFQGFFEKEAQVSRSALQKQLHKNKVDYFEVMAGVSPIKPLMHYIRKRERGLK